MSDKPIIVITMGDPAGVGPEVTAKALRHRAVWDCCRPIVIGEAWVMERAGALGGEAWTYRSIADVSEARVEQERPDVLDLHRLAPEEMVAAQVSAASGLASVGYVKAAAQLALDGKADAIATGPINKAALKLAHVPFIGHTELLASLLGDPKVTTMLSTTGLSVVHVTRHLPLAKVAAQITRENVLGTIRITDKGLKQMGIAQPRLAVAALNPHGGDDGLMGREEIEAIGPAVEDALMEGIIASGPIPADSVFFRAIRGEFDVVVGTALRAASQ